MKKGDLKYMDDIRIFFNIYQKANEVFSTEQLGSLYAEQFLFGQPQGVTLVVKKAFLEILPKRKKFLQTIGLVSSKISSIDIQVLDLHYTQVTVIWSMHFEKRGTNRDNSTKTTYILYKTNNSYEIVVQIDHQDLLERVKQLGLIKK